VLTPGVGSVQARSASSPVDSQCRRGRGAEEDAVTKVRDEMTALGLVALLAGAGTTHFTKPAFYEPIVPRPLGSARAWVLGSGVVELVAAALVAVPRTRRLGGLLAAATFVGVFPANVKAALDGGMAHLDPPMSSTAAAWLRLPLQAPLVVWALRVARSADPVR
jgi:uncharacterized membrane protein